MSEIRAEVAARDNMASTASALAKPVAAAAVTIQAAGEKPHLPTSDGVPARMKSAFSAKDFTPSTARNYGAPRTPKVFHVRQLINGSNDEFLERAYREILGRMPDRDGFTHYGRMLASGIPRTVILSALLKSIEGRQFGTRLRGLRLRATLYGLVRMFGLGQGSRTALSRYINPEHAYGMDEFLVFHGEELIERVYQSLLGRPVDPIGRAHYVDQLLAGMTREQIVMDIARSTEARSRNARVLVNTSTNAIGRFSHLPIVGGLFRLCSLPRELAQLRSHLFVMKKSEAALLEQLAADRSDLNRNLSTSFREIEERHNELVETASSWVKQQALLDSVSKLESLIQMQKTGRANTDSDLELLKQKFETLSGDALQIRSKVDLYGSFMQRSADESSRVDGLASDISTLSRTVENFANTLERLGRTLDSRIDPLDAKLNGKIGRDEFESFGRMYAGLVRESASRAEIKLVLRSIEGIAGELASMAQLKGAMKESDLASGQSRAKVDFQSASKVSSNERSPSRQSGGRTKRV